MRYEGGCHGSNRHSHLKEVALAARSLSVQGLRMKSELPLLMRVFRASAKPGCERELARLLTTESVRLVSGREGLRGWIASGPIDGEYLFMTFWSDEDAVQGFAGETWRDSVLPEGYAELLESHGVAHSTVLGSSGIVG